MSKYYKLMVGIALLALLSFGLVIADESGNNLCIPLGTILLEPPEEVDPKRAAVEFPHAVHFDYNCKACHHTWDGESPVLSCMTSGCHDLAQKPTKEERAADPELALRYYKDAYHAACIGCHKEIKKQNRAMENSYRSDTEPIQSSGPSGCTECHPKE